MGTKDWKTAGSYIESNYFFWDNRAFQEANSKTKLFGNIYITRDVGVLRGYAYGKGILPRINPITRERTVIKTEITTFNNSF